MNPTQLDDSARSTDPLTLRVNDQPHTVAAGSSLAHLLDQLGLGAGQGMAVAINSAVLPRAAWPTHRLRQGDEVLLIQATQGG